MNPNYVMAYQLALQKAREIRDRAARARQMREVRQPVAEQPTQGGIGLLLRMLRLAFR